MAAFYDEIELEDFTYDEEQEIFSYPCPCGDKFLISLDQVRSGEEIARCPSCSLLLRAIYDPTDFADSDESDEEGELLSAEIVVA